MVDPTFCFFAETPPPLEDFLFLVAVAGMVVQRVLQRSGAREESRETKGGKIPVDTLVRVITATGDGRLTSARWKVVGAILRSQFKVGPVETLNDQRYLPELC